MDDEANPKAADATACLIRSIWERNRPVMEDRLRRLEVAAAAAREGELMEELRVEATDLAHKLAGSLGMFGFPQGTEIARKMEVLLNGGKPDGVALTELTVQLREVLSQAG